MGVKQFVEPAVRRERMFPKTNNNGIKLRVIVQGGCHWYDCC